MEGELWADSERVFMVRLYMRKYIQDLKRKGLGGEDAVINHLAVLRGVWITADLKELWDKTVFSAIQDEMKKKINTDKKRNWRSSHRRKNKGNESENDKLSDMQIKRNCESAFNTKKCSNNRLVLDSIWSKKRKRNDFCVEK